MTILINWPAILLNLIVFVGVARSDMGNGFAYGLGAIVVTATVLHGVLKGSRR